MGQGLENLRIQINLKNKITILVMSFIQSSDFESKSKIIGIIQRLSKYGLRNFRFLCVMSNIMYHVLSNIIYYVSYHDLSCISNHVSSCILCCVSCHLSDHKSCNLLCFVSCLFLCHFSWKQTCRKECKITSILCKVFYAYYSMRSILCAVFYA